MALRAPWWHSHLNSCSFSWQCKTWRLHYLPWNQACWCHCVPSRMPYFELSIFWGTMGAGGVGQLCFLKSNVNAEVYQQVLEYFMLPAGEEIFGCANFTFQQDLAPAHSARLVSNTSLVYTVQCQNLRKKTFSCKRALRSTLASALRTYDSFA